MGTRAGIVDLFCGCGGLSLSAKLAGFEIALSIDKDPVLTSSYSSNFPNAHLQVADIRKLSGNDIVRAAGGRPKGIVGGPPCQGFSAMGNGKRSDPRNNLLWHFFRLVADVQPQFFLMENVPGLLFLKNAARLKRALGLVERDYEILPPTLFDAADYGGGTRRRRALIIGYRPGGVERPVFPAPTRPTSAREAIGDIPSPGPTDCVHDGWGWWAYQENPSSKFARRARQIPPLGLGAPIAVRMLRRGFVTGCMETIHTSTVIKRFSKISEGDVEPVSRYPRLCWNEPATTLRAGTGDDLGSFQAARPIHPEANRVISVREAARLQGFPDWFLFHPTKWHSFRMIGNSVSPDMGIPLMRALFSASTHKRAFAAE